MIKKLMMMLALAWAAMAFAAAHEPLTVSQLVPMPDTTARALFVNAPMVQPRVIPELDRNTRLDMLDYYDAGISKPSDNKYGGVSIILSVDSLSIRYMLTDAINCQLFVVPTTGSYLTCIITTYPTPLPDSHILAYSPEWREVDVFAEPRLADWLIDKKSRKEVEETMPFIMASYRYDPATQTLTVTNEMARYWIEAERPAALALLKDHIDYRWDGKRFKQVKQ